MKQHMERLPNKHLHLQGKPQKNIRGTKHRDIMYRYVYKLKLTFDMPYKFKTRDKDLLHKDLIDKPYYAFEGNEYVLITSNTCYYVEIKPKLSVQQYYKEGDSYEKLALKTYGMHGANTYMLIQYINRYKVSKHSIQVII